MWIYNVAIPILGTLVMAVVTVEALRKRRLTWFWLFIFCSASTGWMETIGDWGQELAYSPRLAHYHVSWLPFTTPNDPWFMPFTYAAYWTVHTVVVLSIAGWVAKRFGTSLLKAVIIVAIPVGVIWDLTVETTSAYFGWWTYSPGFGPEIHFARGNQPLLWPMILMCIWPNFIAYVAGKPAAKGLNVIEQWFGLGRLVVPVDPAGVTDSGTPMFGGGGGVAVRTRVRMDVSTQADAAARGYLVKGPRWRFELVRFGAWILTFQLSFFVILCVPLVTLRLLTGHDSIYVP